MIKCNDCGSSKVYEMGITNDAMKNISLHPLNGNPDIDKNIVPYILGCYFCEKCRNIVQITDDFKDEIPVEAEKPTTKQMEYLLRNKNNSEYSDLFLDVVLESLTYDQAWELISKIKKQKPPKDEQKIKKETSPASESQIKYIKDMLHKNPMEKYATFDFSNLTHIRARSIIGDIVKHNKKE